MKQFLSDAEPVLKAKQDMESEPETRLKTVKELFERALAFDLQLPHLLQLKDVPFYLVVRQQLKHYCCFIKK